MKQLFHILIGALDILRYYRGHRDSRGCTVIGEGSILDDLEEIHQERKERRAKASVAILGAEKVKQSSILKFMKPRCSNVLFSFAIALPCSQG